MKNLVTACLVLLLVISLSTAASAQDADQSEFQLQLLHFADVDGGRDIVGNAPHFSALLNKFRGEMWNNTIVLSSGDNWIPGPEYNLASDGSMTDALGTADAGRAHVAWLNAMGVQASAIGNHELDRGIGDFVELISTPADIDDSWAGAGFPYLSTNIDFSTDEDISSFVGRDGAALPNQVAAYTRITTGGEIIGVIGATTPSLGTITSIGDMTIQPADTTDIDALAALIQEDVDALAADGINKIILLAHMQSIDIEKALATKLNGVDIIVAGGSNTILADSNDRLRSGDSATGTYPLMYDGTDGNPTLVVNTDGDYSYLGRLVANFDADGVLITSLLDESINGAYATDEQGLADHGLSASDAIEGVQTISNALGGALEARAGNGVGFTSVYLNGERGSVRTQETNLGNLSADANLAYAQSIDTSTSISLKNGGGIRGPIGSCIVAAGSNDAAVCGAPTGVVGVSEPGEVSQLDLEIAFRFNNGLTLITVTGTELKALLENGVGAVENVKGQFPQIAGMALQYDPSKEAGSRVVTLVAKDANGNPIAVVRNGAVEASAAATTFRMVTLSFLASGGDGFPFPEGDAANIVQLETEDTATGTFTFADDGTEQDVLAEYMAANFGTSETAYNRADSKYKSSITDTRISTIDQ